MSLSGSDIIRYEYLPPFLLPLKGPWFSLCLPHTPTWKGHRGAPFTFPMWDKIRGRKKVKQLSRAQIGSKEELRWEAGVTELPNKSVIWLVTRQIPICTYYCEDSGDR